LEQAEVENKIPQLDALEKSLSVALENGRGSGFTRTSRWRKNDERSSGSTIWSVGVSQNADDV